MCLFVGFGFVLDSSPLWGGSALIFLLLLFRWSEVIQGSSVVFSAPPRFYYLSSGCFTYAVRILSVFLNYLVISLSSQCDRGPGRDTAEQVAVSWGGMGCRPWLSEPPGPLPLLA